MAKQKQTLFFNAHLVGKFTNLYSVLVTDGKVESIVPGEGLPEEVGGGVEMVDCRQADGSCLWLSPGLIDWHTHQRLNAVASHRLDLKTAQSAAEALEMVARALVNPRYDPLIEINLVGVNIRHATWPDVNGLNRRALDEISPDRPVFLMYNGYHSMCVNTVGLAKVGLNVNGYDDGMLYEQESFRVMTDLSNVGEDTLDMWIKQEAIYAASLGVTEIVDLEMTHNLAAWQRRCARGFDVLRVHAGFYDEHVVDAIKLGLKTGDPIPGCNGFVVVGPYKIITDGSLGSQTAFCHDAYPNTSNHGIFAYQPKTLREMIQRGAKHGFEMAIHAIGDQANHLTLRAIADSPPLLPGSTIEHAQLLDFDDLPLFKSLGLIASIQPRHLVDDRDLCHKFWPGRQRRAYAFKSIVDAGIPIKMGSDAPVAPLQPWEALAVAITRAGEGETTPFCAEQIIDLETAYAGSTCNGKLYLEQGESADLCMLPTNPLTCDAKGLRGMTVLGTMLGGSWTWRASPLKA